MNQRAPVPKPSWRLLFAIVLVSIALELRATAVEPEAPAPRRASVPDVELINQNGERVRLQSDRGQKRLAKSAPAGKRP